MSSQSANEVSLPRTRRLLGGAPVWLVCCGLALLVMAVYAPVRHFEFLNYDDDVYVTGNATVQAGVTVQGVKWALGFSEIGHWHPLTWLSHMFDCELFGLNAGGHHLMNVLLHAATAIGLFLVFRRMTGNFWASAFLAALFAVHPLRVESVAWVSERKDVLSGLFFVLTLAAYAHYVRKPESWWRYALVTALFAAGLLSKNMLVTLPFVLLLLDYWPLRRLVAMNGGFRCAALRPLVVEKLPMFLLAIGSCVATALAEETISASGRWTPAFRIENALIAPVVYTWQWVLPVRLAVPYLPSPDGALLWKAVAALALAVAISAVVMAQRRARPYLAVGWYWYLGMLVPVLGLVQISYYTHADRYTYLPQIGLALAVTWLACEMTARWRWLRPVLAALVTVVLAALAWRAHDQVLVWRNNLTLWTHTLNVMPDNAYAHNGLGLALADTGKFDEAQRHYQRALRVRPDFVPARVNLGNALMSLGETDSAIAEFEEALRRQPGHPPILNGLGNALIAAGKPDEAIACYQKAIRANRDFTIAHENLGNALLAQQRVEEAVAAYREAARLQPRSSSHALRLGNALLQRGQVDEAIEWLRTAERLAPDQLDARVSLADALLRRGQTQEALAECQAALRLNPDHVQSHYQMALTLSKQGRFAEAVLHYETTLQLQPAHPQAHNNLGNLLAAAGRSEDALVHYQEALRLEPENLEARNNFGALLLQQSRVAEAVVQYQDVLQRNPDFVPALRNLAWIRAASADESFRDATVALELAGRAVTLTQGRDPASLDALAAAQAEARQFEQAAETAQKALELAGPNSPLARGLEQRLEIYREGRPYRLMR